MPADAHARPLPVRMMHGVVGREAVSHHSLFEFWFVLNLACTKRQSAFMKSSYPLAGLIMAMVTALLLGSSLGAKGQALIGPLPGGQACATPSVRPSRPRQSIACRLHCWGRVKTPASCFQAIQAHLVCLYTATLWVRSG